MKRSILLAAKRIVPLSLLLGGGVLAFRAMPGAQDIEFTVPEGFAVEQVYPADKAGTVVAIAFDSQGRLVLARENGPIVTLFDTNNDGVPDEERAFTDSSSVIGSQGIFFDGPDLLVVGRTREGTGLYRVLDTDGDSRGDRTELVELSTGAIAEHGPHAVFFGPDGYLYWTHGNFSNIYPDPAPLSPVREYENSALLGRDDPRGFGSQYTGGPGGHFMRKNIARHAGSAERPRGAGAAASADWELFAMGFRNQYDGAFNMMGELFTFDSDMEWHRDAPWYRPTRTIHSVPGGDFGYREGTHVHPEYYFDDLPGIEGQGRGSPTGVIHYQGYSYPREYWDMFLQADWSRGRIIGSRLARAGASYSSQTANFVYGEPLNVTDVDVGPDGNVYFALGGRNTQGGIYRVVYRGQNAMQRPRPATPLDRALTLMQPRSAYSRQAAREIKAEMGDAAWQQGLTTEVRNAQAAPDRRVRALELLQVFGPGLDENTLVPLRDDPSWEVRAAAAYYLGMRSSPSARRELAAFLKDSDPFVQRRAAEALLRTGLHPTVNAPLSATEDVLPLLASQDRFVRYAGRRLLQAINPNQWKEAALQLDRYPQAPEALLAYVETVDNANVWEVSRFLRRELELLRANPADHELLDLVRLIQRTVLKDHSVRNFAITPTARGVGALPPPAQAPPAPGAGGGRNQPASPVHAQIGELLLARFPAADSALNREIARTLAYLETPGTVDKLTAELSSPRNGREQQMWYAEVLSFVDSGWESPAMERMAAFVERMYREDWRGGASFGGAVNRIRDDFLAKVPANRREVYAKRFQAAVPQIATAPAGGGFQATVSEEELFEELVYNPNVRQGTPEGGVVAFQKATCIACHTFGPIGRESGPDLTTINQRFTRRDLVRAIVFPDETVSDLWETEEITRTNGQRVVGTIARDDPGEIVVQLPGSQTQITIPKSQIRSRVRSEKSPMPHGLLNLLNSQERRNLLLLLEAGPSVMPDTALARLGVAR